MLEKHLKYNLELINMKLAIKVNYEYIQSDEFMSLIAQSIHSSQLAESERKIEYIARSLAGCMLNFEGKEINRVICTRIMSQITLKEMDFIIDIIKDGRFIRKMEDSSSSVPFVETPENTILVRGLVQLGLLVEYSGYDQSIHLQPSGLAEQVAFLALQTVL